MKYYFPPFALAFVFFLGGCSSSIVTRRNAGPAVRDTPRQNFGGVKKKIVLLPFFNESPFGGKDLGVTVTEELRRELARTGEFSIDPHGEKIYGSSREVYAGGGSNLVQLGRRAKNAGINFVLYGRIAHARIREKSDDIGLVRKTKYYTESNVEVRIFDVNTSKEVFHSNFRGYADDSQYKFFTESKDSQLSFRRKLLRYGVQVAARRSIPPILTLARKLEWVGQIARVIGQRIYINAGRMSGLHINDMLKVISEGDKIYDPETGALIGTARGEVKGTLKIIDHFGTDGSIALLHSGGQVVEGDQVQLY